MPVPHRLLGAAAAVVALTAAEVGPRREAPKINLGGVVNAASQRPAPENFVSPGAIISIYGSGLSTETREVRASDLVNGFLPEILAGVSVFFGPVPAPLFYISPGQINAQTPTTLQPGEWEVKVRLNNLESSEKVIVRPYSPGLFHAARRLDASPVDARAPARPGELIVLFGTGYGPTRPPLLSGALAPPGPTWMDNPVEASIGGIPLGPAEILYAGLAPGFAGLYQFNLRVPLPAPGGDLEVLVKVADSWSQPGVRLAVER